MSAFRITFDLLYKYTFPIFRIELIRDTKSSCSACFTHRKLFRQAKVFSLLFVVVLLSNIGCGISNNNLIEQYNDFAIRSAKANLWNEAILRWKKIIEIEPNNAKAHNNLAIAYEAIERFDEALAEYEKTIELDPGNGVYQKNFFRFQKNRKRYLYTEGTVKEDKEKYKESK